jgi:hypothetical protein
MGRLRNKARQGKATKAFSRPPTTYYLLIRRNSIAYTATAAALPNMHIRRYQHLSSPYLLTNVPICPKLSHLCKTLQVNRSNAINPILQIIIIPATTVLCIPQPPHRKKKPPVSQ